MTYMGVCQCDTSTCDKFNGSMTSGPKSTKSEKSRTGALGYQQGISAYHSPLSSDHTPHQHTKTQHIVNAKPAVLTLPTQVTPGDYLDHRPPPSQVLSTLHANLPRWLQNRYPRPDCLPFQAHAMTTNQASTIRAYTQPLSPVDLCRTSPLPQL